MSETGLHPRTIQHPCRSVTLLLLVALPLAVALSELGCLANAAPRGANESIAAASPVIEDSRALLARQVAAWNRGDLEGFLDDYFRGAELSFASARGLRRGWDDVRDRYRESYGDRAAMGTLALEILEARDLGENHALIVGTWRLERERDRPHGIFSIVLARTNDGMKIIHDHTSVDASLARTPDIPPDGTTPSSP
jgi:hypothetical protein